MASRLTEEEKEQGLRLFSSRRYLASSKSYCGTPEDMWIRVEGKRVCPRCSSLKVKERRCNKCGELFQPGCKIKFLCVNCIHNNNKHEE